MGHHQLEMRRADSIELAIGYFDQAIDRDPTFALAYAEQSFAYFLSSDLPLRRTRPNDEAIDLAEAAAHQALALDERHWADLAGPAWRYADARGDRAGSDAAARRAYELNPRYAGSDESLPGRCSTRRGDSTKALALNERIVALDPLSAV